MAVTIKQAQEHAQDAGDFRPGAVPNTEASPTDAKS
jgi:hypothetical protein